jgi:hypothetical protein
MRFRHPLHPDAHYGVHRLLIIYDDTHVQPTIRSKLLLLCSIYIALPEEEIGMQLVVSHFYNQQCQNSLCVKWIRDNGYCFHFISHKVYRTSFNHC